MERLMNIIFAVFATAIICAAWGEDAPIYNFALIFGGILIGHVLTEALNSVDDEEV